MYTALQYADRHDLSHLQRCTADVSRRFLEKERLLNPANAKAVLLGSGRRLLNIGMSGGVSATTVHFEDALKLLGFSLDSALSVDRHASEIVRSCEKL